MSVGIPLSAQVTAAAAEVLPPDAFLGAACDAAAGILRALGVPAHPIAESAKLGAAYAGGTDYGINIAGEPARLSWVSLERNAEAFRSRLRYDVTRNAPLFITPAVVDLLRARWDGLVPRPAVADISPGRLSGLLRECVGLGCRVDRLADAQLEGDERDSPEWRILEAALEAAATLHIVVSAGFMGDEAPAAVSESLRDLVHGSTGVILPIPEIREAEPAGAHVIEVAALDVVCSMPAGAPAAPAAERIAAAIEPWLPSFVTREVVLFKIHAAERSLPLLTGRVRERYGDVFLTRMCRIMTADGLGIADFRSVLGGLLEIREATSADESRYILFHSPAGTPPPKLALADDGLDPGDAADCVRRWARRQVTTTHWREGTIRVRLLAPELESSFRAGGIQPGSEAQHRFLEQLNGSAEPILTNVDVRRRVSDALKLERPDVPVLCYQELLPESSIIPIERVSV